MKRIILLFLFCIYNISFAESSLKDQFEFSNCRSETVKILYYGTLEENTRLSKDSNYSQCWFFSLNNLNAIDSIYLFPCECNTANKNEGKFEINGQKFIFKDTSIFVPEIKMNSITYNGKRYLLLFNSIGKYGDKECFIFDITEPGKILFYPPEERFVEAEIKDNFFGIYQNKLCFLFSKRRFNWNGQYRLQPYYINGNTLKELCDKKGNPYFIDYTYKTKFEEEYVIDGLYVPKSN